MGDRREIRRWIRTCVATRWLLCLLPFVASLPCAAEESPRDHVVLRSGRILAGRVVGSRKVGGTRFLRVETDFGEILVPGAEAKERVVVEDRDKDAAFRIRHVRVVRSQGRVERQRTEGGPWLAAGAPGRYAPEEGESDDFIVPGDTIRTGPQGTIDLMPHKDVWIRIAPDSEVVIAGGQEDATLVLRRGTTVQRIAGRPRGATYRIRTRSSLVDHVFVQGGTPSFFSLRAGNPDQVTVKEGAARVNGKRIVGAGQSVRDEAAPALATPAQLRVLPRHTPRFPTDDLAYVPPGTYRVGGDPHVYDERGVRSTESNAGCRPFEVVLQGYLIDRREVTAGEFYDFVVAQRDGLARGIEPVRPQEDRDRWPVVHQSWNTAVQFARWCGKALPTEAQWEVAAHGGTPRQQPWGGGFSRKYRELPRGRWVRGQWLPPVDLRPVDEPTLDLSILGVRGLTTNATEWCRDEWSASPFHKQMIQPTSCEGRAVRGYYAHMRLRHCVNVDATGPLVPGFRCVVELPALR